VAALASLGASAAHSASPSTSTTPVARAVPAPRPIMSRTGKPFIPVLGDWEGTVNGNPASFQLGYDTSFHRPNGLPSYGVGRVVAFLPSTCPAVASYHSESLINGAMSNNLGRYGGLGLSRFGFGGLFTGKRSATLTHGYAVKSCRGRLTWHMHPSNRLPVTTGGWKLQYTGGQSAAFSVGAGGRLAAAIPLPRALAKCNGARGAVDLFIEPSGRASISQSSLVRLSMRFSKRRASGQLNAGGRGCAGGPIRFTASAKNR
jgi:hypothetical protein